MAKIACSLLIRQQTNIRGATGSLSRVGGWSEGWWYDGTDSDAMDKLVIISEFRARCLTNAAQVIGQRVRVLGGGSRTLNRTFPGNLVVRADIPQMGVLCSLKGIGGANVRRFILRGIPDARVEEGEYDPSDTFMIPLRGYIQQVQNQGFAFKAVDLTKLAYPVLTISNAGAVLLSQDASFGTGSLVKGLRVSDADNGLSIPFTLPIVPGSDAKHWTLVGWTHPAASGGRIREVATVYPIVDASTFELVRVTTHKVGKDFFQFHGRASKRN